MKNTIAVAVGAVILSIGAGTGGAVAAGLISSGDIKNDTIRSSDLRDGRAVSQKDLKPGLERFIESQAGKDGKDSLEGVVYRVLDYTNGGAGDATVACADDEATSQQYVAISGGVQAGQVSTEGPNEFAVTASFPGRMDWSTGEPKPGRLDGWIVLGNGQHTDNLKVWALCVPKSSIGNVPVQVGTLDN